MRAPGHFIRVTSSASVAIQYHNMKAISERYLNTDFILSVAGCQAQIQMTPGMSDLSNRKARGKTSGYNNQVVIGTVLNL